VVYTRQSSLGASTSPASGAVRPRKGAARPCKRLLLRCAAGSSVSPTARHAARRIIEGYWTLSGALFFVSCNWFCESVTVGARRDFFFARTAQPFGRVRTPGTDQTTRKRVSRRSTSICVGNRVRRSTIETVQRTDVASWDRWRAKIGDRHTCRACDCASPASFSKNHSS